MSQESNKGKEVVKTVKKRMRPNDLGIGREKPSHQVSEHEISYANSLPHHSKGDDPDYPENRIDLTAAKQK